MTLPPSSAEIPEVPVYLVIPGGGKGVRMGGTVPKQFQPFRGHPLLFATLQAFLQPGMPALAGVALAVPMDRREEVATWAFPVPVWVTEGGQSRQESVARALACLPGAPETPVLIHDAVRPNPPVAPIRAALAALASWDGAVLAEASTDTLKQVDSQGRILATIPRDEVFRAQTPQVARLGLWREAFQWAEHHGFQGTDDLSLLEAMGCRVCVIPSPPSNLKITTPEDWARAEVLPRLW